MSNINFNRLPKHIGIIPDGNRRWALLNGFSKQDGYKYGINPGFLLYNECISLGIKELTFYGFTKDNTKRPSEQTKEFSKACIDAVEALSKQDGELLVVGDYESKMFPSKLIPYTKRTLFGKGGIKLNFLVNYSWDWDIGNSFFNESNKRKDIESNIKSSDISRMDLIIRWGGRRRLSGFLPIQSVYSDFYIIDDLWPNFKTKHLYEALDWYQNQDITLGG